MDVFENKYTFYDEFQQAVMYETTHEMIVGAIAEASEQGRV